MMGKGKGRQIRLPILSLCFDGNYVCACVQFRQQFQVILSHNSIGLRLQNRTLSLCVCLLVCVSKSYVL